MHKHEIKDDQSIKLSIVVAVIINNFSPGSFSENLHHYILRMNESLEIVEFRKLVVRWRWISIFLGWVEKLHTHNTKNEEEYSEQEKKSSNDGKYLHESLEQSSKFEYILAFKWLNSFTHNNSPEQKCHSEHSIYDKKVINVAVVSGHKEKYYIEHDKKRINVIPSISKVSLWPNTHDSDK